MLKISIIIKNKKGRWPRCYNVDRFADHNLTYFVPMEGRKQLFISRQEDLKNIKEFRYDY